MKASEPVSADKIINEMLKNVNEARESGALLYSRIRIGLDPEIILFRTPDEIDFMVLLIAEMDKSIPNCELKKLREYIRKRKEILYG